MHLYCRLCGSILHLSHINLIFLAIMLLLCITKPTYDNCCFTSKLFTIVHINNSNDLHIVITHSLVLVIRCSNGCTPAIEIHNWDPDCSQSGIQCGSPQVYPKSDSQTQHNWFSLTIQINHTFVICYLLTWGLCLSL